MNKKKTEGINCLIIRELIGRGGKLYNYTRINYTILYKYLKNT